MYYVSVPLSISGTNPLVVYTCWYKKHTMNSRKNKLFSGTIACAAQFTECLLHFVCGKPITKCQKILTIAFIVLCCLKLLWPLKGKVEVFSAQEGVYYILAHAHLGWASFYNRYHYPPWSSLRSRAQVQCFAASQRRKCWGMQMLLQVQCFKNSNVNSFFFSPHVLLASSHDSTTVLTMWFTHYLWRITTKTSKRRRWWWRSFIAWFPNSCTKMVLVSILPKCRGRCRHFANYFLLLWSR